MIDPAALAKMAALAEEPADPLEVRDQLLWFIEDAIRNHPRSLQEKIGPSEIGHECGRWIGYKMAGAPTFNDFARTRDGWRPTVGTAVHTWLADVFTAANPAEIPLFAIEQRLRVGTLAPIADGEPDDIEGHGDIWFAGIAIDWKIVGPSTLKKTKAVSRQTGKPHGPSQRYRKQIHSYGTGWRRMGLPVHDVMIAYLPSSGELRADSFFWHEPYDATVAAQAVARVSGTNKLMAAAMAEGTAAVDRALAMLPTADAYCTACPYFVPQPERLSRGCPGDPGRYVPRDPFAEIAPVR